MTKRSFDIADKRTMFLSFYTIGGLVIINALCFVKGKCIKIMAFFI